MILNIHFYPLNGYDNLHITVDKFSEEVIFDKEKWLNDNERLFCKIYADGHARYGLEMQNDPAHNDQKYTWSSRAEVMNQEFNLYGTEYQLAQSDIGMRELEGMYSCYFGVGYILKNMLKLALANQKSLTYGFVKLYEKQAHSKFTIVKPTTGLKLGSTRIEVNGVYYIDTDMGWLNIRECSDYILKKKGVWCLRDWFYKELI